MTLNREFNEGYREGRDDRRLGRTRREIPYSLNTKSATLYRALGWRSGWDAMDQEIKESEGKK